MPDYENNYNILAEQDDEDEKEGKGKRQIDARGVQGIAPQQKEESLLSQLLASKNENQEPGPINNAPATHRNSTIFENYINGDKFGKPVNNTQEHAETAGQDTTAENENFVQTEPKKDEETSKTTAKWDEKNKPAYAKHPMYENASERKNKEEDEPRINQDFEYDSFGFQLNGKDKPKKWREVLNGLADKILNYGPASTPEQWDELEQMTKDYFKLSYFSPTIRFKKITPKDIAKSNNSPFLADMYARHQVKKKNIMQRHILIGSGVLGSGSFVVGIISMTAAAAISTAAIFPVFFTCVGIGMSVVAAAVGRSIYLGLKSLKNNTKAWFKVKKMKREKVKQLKNELKQNEKELKSIKKERKNALKQAHSEEERKKIEEYYEQKLAEQNEKCMQTKRYINQTKEDAKQILKNFPENHEFDYIDTLKKGNLDKLKEEYKKELKECKKQGATKERKREIKEKYKKAKEKIYAEYNASDKVAEYCIKGFYEKHPEKIGKCLLVDSKTEKRLVQEMNEELEQRRLWEKIREADSKQHKSDAKEEQKSAKAGIVQNQKESSFSETFVSERGYSKPVANNNLEYAEAMERQHNENSYSGVSHVETNDAQIAPESNDYFEYFASKAEHAAFINELQDKILNFGPANTPEKQQEFYNLYSKYSAHTTACVYFYDGKIDGIKRIAPQYDPSTPQENKDIIKYINHERRDYRVDREIISNGLEDQILKFGKADTPEKQKILSDMCYQYIKINNDYESSFDQKIPNRKLDKDAILHSENADILIKSTVKANEYTKYSANNNIEKLLVGGAAAGWFALCAGAFSLFSIPVGPIFFAAASVAGVLYALSPLIKKMANRLVCAIAKGKAKRILKNESKQKIKENKKEIKKLKEKRKEELKNARTREEKAEIKAKYEKLIDESKQAIAQEKATVKEKIKNMPTYNECKYKDSTNPDISKFMAEEATRVYKQNHGIEAAAPTEKPKQAEQQVTHEKVALAEHKAERVTGMQQRQKDERVAGMRK